MRNARRIQRGGGNAPVFTGGLKISSSRGNYYPNTKYNKS